MSTDDLTALASRLRHAALAYYDTDTLVMTDAEYDAGIETLRIAVADDPSLEGQFNDLLDAVAAGQSAGGDVEHPTLMGSLEKAPALETVYQRNRLWAGKTWCPGWDSNPYPTRPPPGP